ncbi:hypothetical protein DB41_KJ00160, partial [Neochlamydia sp. TUME1]
MTSLKIRWLKVFYFILAHPKLKSTYYSTIENAALFFRRYFS